MAWVKLDTGIFRNPKVVTVSADAKLLYVAGICYAGDNLTDGLIPAHALPILGAESAIRNVKRPTAELVNAGLWIARDGVYEVHDYLDHNSRSGDVQAKRDAARDRMQRNRSQNVRANKMRSSQEVRPTKEDRSKKKEITPSSPPSGDDLPPNVVRVDAPRTDAHERRWECFWAAYPKHVGTGAARKVFDRIKPDDALTDSMVAAIEAAKQSEQWRRDNGQFIPHPSTWLNQRRWEDETGAATTGPAGVDLLPGEVATEVAPGHWELEAGGIKRVIKPEYNGVIWDPRTYRGSDGTTAFYAAVRDAAAKHEQEAA